MQLEVDRDPRDGKESRDCRENKENYSIGKLKENASLVVRDNKKKKSNDFGINGILKEAREDLGPSSFHEEKKMRKIHLNPILKI